MLLVKIINSKKVPWSINDMLQLMENEKEEEEEKEKSNIHW